MAARGVGRHPAGLVALAAAIVVLIGACGGSPRDLGTVQPRQSLPDRPGPWRLVEVEGIAPSPGRIEPALVEVDLARAAMTVFFEGGNPDCHAVSGVEVERRDPAVPSVTVLYGTRMWVIGCTADLASLAIRVPLDPPFAP